MPHDAPYLIGLQRHFQSNHHKRSVGDTHRATHSLQDSVGMNPGVGEGPCLNGGYHGERWLSVESEMSSRGAQQNQGQSKLQEGSTREQAEEEQCNPGQEQADRVVGADTARC